MGWTAGGSCKNGIAQICLRFPCHFWFCLLGGARMETCDLKFWSRVWVRIPQDTRSILIQRDSWHSLRLWFAVSLPRLSTQRQIFLHVCAAKVFSSFWPFLDAPSCLLDPPPKILIVFWLGHVLLAGWDSCIDLFFFLRYGCPAPSKDRILIPGCAKILRSKFFQQQRRSAFVLFLHISTELRWFFFSKS